MKKDFSKTEALSKINEFFVKDTFTPEEMRKTKRLAMKYKIRLGNLRKRFCKYCLNPLKGKTRITKTHKTIVCEKCGRINRFILMYS